MVTDAPRTITTDNTPLITGTLTDNAISNVIWTAAGGDTSTITHGIVYYDSPNTLIVGDSSINIELSDESNWYIRTDIKEEPPKTYLQLPTGKRLISI